MNEFEIYDEDTEREEQAAEALDTGLDCYEAGLASHDIEDFERAEHYLEESRQLGNARASVFLGYIHYYGFTGERDFGHALRLFGDAAEAGDGEACYKIGDMYARGMGVDKDEKQAFELYQDSYELGEGEDAYIEGSAAFRLARCYENGIGCDADLNRALRFYRFAAEGLTFAIDDGLAYFTEHRDESIEAIDRLVAQGMTSGEVEEQAFRDLWHRPCFIRYDARQLGAFEKPDAARPAANELPDAARSAAIEFPEGATAVLVYPYIDREAGMSFEVLSPADLRKRTYFTDYDPTVRSGYRCVLSWKDVSDCPMDYCDDPEQVIDDFAEHCHAIDDRYDVGHEIDETRFVTEVDELRNPEFPDDIFVFLFSGDRDSKGRWENEPEGVWVQLDRIDGSRLVGTLRNEPFADCGMHEGDALRVELIADGAGDIHAATQPSMKLPPR